MFYLKNLLRNEYFPAELPPCFNSNDLADNSELVLEWTNNFNKNYSIPVIYNGYKSESSRRRFAVPNAYHYCKAIEIIINHSDDIFKILNKSRISLTAPQKTKPQINEAYKKKTSGIGETKAEIEKIYQCNMFEIRLDINSFFDSVYSHSIPWAIHGKSASKKDKSANLWGNTLDAAIRSLNYNQTNGILVGNAVSRIISEIILCTIDCKIKNKFPGIASKRFVDDYYIYTNDSNRIKPIISFVIQSLGEFELRLNENKLQINESPFIYGKPWVEKIKQYLHLNPEIFLSRIVMEYNDFKDISIIRYGLKVIWLYKYDKNSWATMESKLINLWVKFPSLSDLFIIIFMQNKNNIQKSRLVKALQTIMDNSLSLMYEQEIIWAVWFFKVFDLPITHKYIKKILNSGNTLAIIILLDCLKTRKLDKNKSVKKLMDDLYNNLIAEDTDEKGNPNNIMWTDVWLLAYEIDLNKWLNDGTKSFEFARKNQFYKKLLSKKIEFYDKNFTYSEIKLKEHMPQYTSREELYKTLNSLKKSISEKSKENQGKEKINLTPDEAKLFEAISTTLLNGEY